ncbi:MAG: DUF2202 domain-containing protein [Bacteroidales bacterium]|nr:DUF2202 domain-containing protein [Bacteroidales bacterium]
MENYLRNLALSTAALLTMLVFVQCQKTASPAESAASATEKTDRLNSAEQAAAADASLILTDSLPACVHDKIYSMPVEPLSDTERNVLEFVREEELLAHDVYVFLGAHYNLPIFKHIAKSERFHANVMLALLQKYALADPAENHQEGVFANSDIQLLYNQFTEQGLLSLEDALTVGETIEDFDIADLVAHLDGDVDNADLGFSLEQLTKGSRNHLRAFYAHLSFRNLTYTPQYISQEMYDQIVASPWETGNGFCGCAM